MRKFIKANIVAIVSLIKRVDWTEPARLQAAWVSILGLCAALGITVGADVDGWVQAALVAIATIAPLLQGEATRERVYSPQKADQLYRTPPGDVPDHTPLRVPE